MPTREQLEEVLNGRGRVMQVYSQTLDPMGSPSLGLGGLCSGLSYSFLRGQLKAARDLVRRGCYFDFHRATAHARFAQASMMIAHALSPDEDRFAPLARHDRLTIRQAFQVAFQELHNQGRQNEIGREIALHIELEMLGRNDWMYALLSIYTPTRASHAIALKAQCDEGPYYLYDANLGLFHFTDTATFDDGFSALFARYYPRYYGCKMRELSQN
jgi:hypothetical protein